MAVRALTPQEADDLRSIASCGHQWNPPSAEANARQARLDALILSGRVAKFPTFVDGVLWWGYHLTDLGRLALRVSATIRSVPL